MKENPVRTASAILLSVGILLSVNACGGGMGAAHSDGGPAGTAAGPERGFIRYFTYEPLKVEPHALQYDLPLERGSIIEFEKTISDLMLRQEAQSRLLDNGFVVTVFPFDRMSEHFDEAYMVLDRRDVPVLITSSSLLHAYHILFDYTLQTVEARELYDRLWRLASALFDGCLAVYETSDGDLKEAARRDAAFLAVGLTLLKPDPEGDYLKVGRETRQEVDESGRTRVVEEIELPSGYSGADLDREFTTLDVGRYDFETPAGLAPEVGEELDLIARHQGFSPSPLFKYTEDYSQYVPRGHYTVSQKLRHYFRAMMWFGRMSMLLKGSKDIPVGGTCSTCDALISEYDARIQTIGACLVASRMATDSEAMKNWDKVYEVTSFFVGFSDDLGPYQYIEALREVLGGVDQVTGFGPEVQGRLKAELAEYRGPKIYGGTGECTIQPPFTPEQADQCLAKTRGFRLMGQRYVPDSYVFSRLVTPYVGRYLGKKMPFTAYEIPGVGIMRVFPRGLDLFAVMGSDRALDLLDDMGDDDYEDYGEAFRKMYDEIDAVRDEEWNQNLYWNWLWVLKSLIKQDGKGYPSFMRTPAWQDRLLTAALASWAELRHDTILYAKQSYTVALTAVPPAKQPERPAGFVEPVPEVYNRLVSVTRMMRLGLVDMGILGETEVSVANMKRFERTLEWLADISARELEGEMPGPTDADHIQHFGDTLKDLLDGVERDSKKSTMVADVHTDSNSRMVLEEGCGYVELLVAAWKTAHGIRLAAGPEMSYYEFKQPMQKRLTDEEWRSMLELQKPDEPPWTSSYRVDQ
jgi:hypothetical protein